MANLSSGSKRPHSHLQESESSKRPRSDRDQRNSRARRDGDSSSRRRRSQDRHPSRDRDRERDRERDSRVRDRDRDRERDRRNDRARGRGRDEREKRRSRSRDRRTHGKKDGDRRRSTSRSPATSRPAPVHKDRDSEREEGEISPQSSRAPTPAPPRTTTQSSTKAAPAAAATSARTARVAVPEVPEPELELSTSPVPVEVSLAARRAKRQEILAKYAGVASVTAASASPIPDLNSAAQPPPTPISVPSNLASQIHSVEGTPAPPSIPTQDPSTVHTNGHQSPPDTPSDEVFELEKDNEQEDVQVEAYTQAQRDGDQMISAADYDPSLDRREDEERRVRGTQNETNGNTILVDAQEEEEEEEEDFDDMFAIGDGEKKKRKVVAVAKPSAPALITTTLDTASDSEGYYQIILGELLDGGRYQVFASLGKGMFANVVRARQIHEVDGEVGKEVAIKIIRSQESMFKAGQKEIQILNKLKVADPEDKKHLVRLERSFEHRGHLCLVFESLSMNLRDVVKKFGKDVGLNIRAVRAYAQQLFLALSLLRKCNIMHADIKPDNILVNEHKTVLKLCDLGSASDAAENEITPYLVSRFYRAPEIILGFPYDPSLDIWSVGCTLYELYTGKILLPGRSNNQMLYLMMELKGRFNSKMIKKAKFGANYFDDKGGFSYIERDRVTGADMMKSVHISKPTRDLRIRLLPSSVQLKDDEHKLLTSFVDLLDRCLSLDPARRITPKEALAHPFIRG